MRIDKLYRLTCAAAKTGVPVTTIRSAVDRGELPTQVTACGLHLVALSNLERWKREHHRPHSVGG